jgi:hypothetical protein
MISKQYQCGDCSAVFESAAAKKFIEVLTCLACSSADVAPLSSTLFYANKNFCPHDKELDAQSLKGKLKVIMADNSLKCGGCGVDGPKGSCGTKSGGCGGNCSCGKQSQSNKLNINLYSNDLVL